MCPSPPLGAPRIHIYCRYYDRLKCAKTSSGRVMAVSRGSGKPELLKSVPAPCPADYWSPSRSRPETVSFYNFPRNQSLCSALCIDTGLFRRRCGWYSPADHTTLSSTRTVAAHLPGKTLLFAFVARPLTEKNDAISGTSARRTTTLA